VIYILIHGLLISLLGVIKIKGNAEIMSFQWTEKYKGIADSLKKQIDSGCFKEKLPGQRQLSRIFSANVITIRKALSLLESEGIVEKKPCRGIFIKKLNTGIQNTQMVCCLLPTQGHIYSEMSNMLTSRLQSKGYFPLIINTLKHQMNDKDFLVQLEKVIGTEPAAIIIDGHYEFPYRLFNRNCRHIKNLTIIFRSRHPFQNSLKVLSDGFHGGYIGGAHLISQGCRKIIFLHPSKKSFLLRPGSEDIFKGFEMAVRSSKHLQKINYSILEGEFETPEGGFHIPGLKAKIREWKPDAIFASADYLLKPVYEFASDNNIAIPGDIALLGYYDTPWTETYPIPLSSISIEAGEIVECAVEKTLANTGGAKNMETIMIKPRLQARQSSLKA
jgi:DNA-binding LacI/PurR family transcriptional regulator